MQPTRRDVHKAALAGVACALAADVGTAPASAQQSARSYKYVHLDVFTGDRLAGNQLAVFLEPQGLDDETMQAFAREINFSESTFVFPPGPAGTDHRVRIFATNRELPFAGHPVIGTTFALAHAGIVKAGRSRIVLGLGAGPTPVDLEWNGAALSFAWMTQQLPQFGKTMSDGAAVASALGLEPASVVDAKLPVQEASCGSWFLYVPVTTREAVDRVMVDPRAMDVLFKQYGIERRGIFVFSSEKHADGAAAYSRMMSLAGTEDPATGSAAGPLGCYLVRHRVVTSAQAERMLSIQGVKMKRPSRLHINITMKGDDITAVRVGGQSVVVGDGSLRAA